MKNRELKKLKIKKSTISNLESAKLKGGVPETYYCTSNDISICKYGCDDTMFCR